jgi:hypothetical protein
MKKITLLTFAICIVFLMNLNAKVISLVSGNNVGTTLSAATTLSGDTIELTQTGTYYWNAQVAIGNGTSNFAPKSITIRAKAGLSSRPIIQCLAASNIFALALYKTDGSTIVLDGIEFDGNNKVSYIWVIKSYNLGAAAIAPKFNVKMNNCYVHNLAFGNNTNAQAFSYSHSAPIPAPGYLSISNSIFQNIPTAAYYTDGLGRPDSLNFNNCYIKGPFTATGSQQVAAISNKQTVSGAIRKIIIDHCTFDGNDKQDLNLLNVSGDATSTTIIKNSIFLNNTGTIENALGTGGNYMNKCGIFGATNTTTVYPSVTCDETTLFTDPMLDPIGHFITAAEYGNLGGDGNTLGYYAPITLTGLNSSKYKNNFSVVQNGNSLLIEGVIDVNFQIIGLTGSLVKSGFMTGNKINIQFLDKGMYILKLNDKAIKFILK